MLVIFKHNTKIILSSFYYVVTVSYNFTNTIFPNIISIVFIVLHLKIINPIYINLLLICLCISINLSRFFCLTHPFFLSDSKRQIPKQWFPPDLLLLLLQLGQECCPPFVLNSMEDHQEEENNEEENEKEVAVVVLVVVECRPSFWIPGKEVRVELVCFFLRQTYPQTRNQVRNFIN